ncbi:MAG: PhnD/SsuA/transferrin family substrate-binding protein [Xanthomonadales bacterium]|nr:PhnD/SsuA/transferrin family substrate-binding protein [Xanthomonadales bacterium]
MPWASALAQDSYTLLVEPSYPPETAAEVYRPLLDYLRQEAGLALELRTVRDYLVYWRDLRGNQAADFVFEDAHFTDYRSRRFGFVPLVKAGEPMRFVLLVPREEEGTGPDDLVGRRVATLPAPSLGFLVLRDMFADPVARPQVVASLSSWQDGPSLIFAGEVAATLAPASLAQELQNLVAVAQSRDFPGTALSAAPTVPPEVRERVVQALTVLHEKAVAGSVGLRGAARAQGHALRAGERRGVPRPRAPARALPRVSAALSAQRPAP